MLGLNWSSDFYPILEAQYSPVEFTILHASSPKQQENLLYWSTIMYTFGLWSKKQRHKGVTVTSCPNTLLVCAWEEVLIEWQVHVTKKHGLILREGQGTGFFLKIFKSKDMWLQCQAISIHPLTYRELLSFGHYGLFPVKIAVWLSLN